MLPPRTLKVRSPAADGRDDNPGERFMTRIASMLVAACTAVMISGSAFAQAPAAAPARTAGPAAPMASRSASRWRKRPPPRAVAEAQKNNWGMCIAVVAPSGDLIYFEKMDNCQYASIKISQHKARASAIFRRPTLAFENGLAAGRTPIC